jgi:hypothetical protein
VNVKRDAQDNPINPVIIQKVTIEPRPAQ